MIKRLEQVAALVVAAGLAIVSYWLFFSWAQGGGSQRRDPPNRSQAAPRLEQPLLAGRIVERSDVVAHLVGAHRQVVVVAQGHDAGQGA
jgi:hypothetical protein